MRKDTNIYTYSICHVLIVTLFSILILNAAYKFVPNLDFMFIMFYLISGVMVVGSYLQGEIEVFIVGDFIIDYGLMAILVAAIGFLLVKPVNLIKMAIMIVSFLTFMMDIKTDLF